MKYKKIYRVKTPGDSHAFLTYEEPIEGYDKVFPLGKPSLEELVDLCDHNAESQNAHEFCGIHNQLSFILMNELGHTQAVKIMQRIANQGGLHNLCSTVILAFTLSATLQSKIF